MSCRSSFFIGLFSVISLGIGRVALAEDIDIFSVGNNIASSDVPNVLFVWDNTANWSVPANTGSCRYFQVDTTTWMPKKTGEGAQVYGDAPADPGSKLAIEQCALYNTILSLPTGASDTDYKFRIGFMLFSEQTNIKGAYPRISFTNLTRDNKISILSKIKGLEKNTDKGANALYSAAMHEAWLYFKGAAPYLGDQPTNRDYLAFQNNAAGTGNYVSYSNAGCSRNHIIFIANGSPDSNEQNSCPSMLSSMGGSMSPPTGTAGSDADNCIEEYARAMYNADISTKDDAQNIRTHAIAVVDPTKVNTKPEVGYQLLMQATARFGGGSYYLATSADQIVNGLLDTFNSMLAENSMFTSASLPVSVTGQSQGYFLNQVFMGLFRPDSEAKPRWVGNLKQYKFKFDIEPTTGYRTLFLTDAGGVDDIIDKGTGFIKPTATSYWTSASNFWVNNPKGTPASASDAPDGNIVEKGGAAQKLRTAYATSQISRKVYTAISGALVDFDCSNSSIASASLGVANTACDDTSDRKLLMDWIRGADNKTADNEKGPGAPTTVRPSIHGDVLHSRPSVVAYSSNTDLLVLYGANDGMLHAVDGNQSSGGGELWSFIAPETYGKFKRLRDNSPEIYLPGGTSPTATRRDYFIDGPITTYKHGGKVYAYVTARRGGRFVYAFDITAKAAPVLLWKIDQSSIETLGQTWSAATIGKLKGWNNPVIFMGGGYDSGEDNDPPTASSPAVGRGIYALDALTGAVLKSWTTNYAVPADITLVNDLDGYVERAYGADVGGNVYRIVIGKDESTGKATLPDGLGLVASIDPARSSQRKFFYGPGVLKDVDDSGNTFFAVMIGSGDREKPLRDTNKDYFYAFKDYGGATLVFADLNQALLCNLGLIGKKGVNGEDLYETCVAQSAANALASEYKGCYIELPNIGEKVVNSPLATYGDIYFGTSTPTSPPTANSCSNKLGSAYGYAMPYLCGVSIFNRYINGGLPPTPVGGIVSLTTMVDGKATDLNVPFVIGGISKDGAASSSIGSAPPPQKKFVPIFKNKRRYWHHLQGR